MSATVGWQKYSRVDGESDVLDREEITLVRCTCDAYAINMPTLEAALHGHPYGWGVSMFEFCPYCGCILSRQTIIKRRE